MGGERRAPLETILQIHDEPVFEVDEADADRAAGAVKEIMEWVAAFHVTLAVDVATGRHWGEI